MSGLPLGVVVLAAVLLGGLAALGLTLHSLVYGPRARLRRRLQQVVGAQKAAKTAATGNRRRSLQAKLKEIESTRQKKRGWRLREQLIQSGLPWDVRRFALFSLASGLAGGLAGGMAGLPPIGWGASAVIGGMGLPRLVLQRAIDRRLANFTRHFADAIDVIVRGIRSGLPVGECFHMIAREAPEPVGTEFRLIVEGQRLGLTLEEALQKAVERVPTAELRYFAIVLGIQQTTGGNLAETLAKLSEVLRGRKRMRDKIQAMSSEAKASAGIIGSLPVAVALLLLVIAPQYISLLFTTETGHLLLLIGAGTMALGIFVMRRMINFDI